MSHSEKIKAAKFSRPELQKKFINTRGILRKILATYLDKEPQDIIIKQGEYGKPFVQGSSLYFNLSHTGNHFALVVSSINHIGIDIEKCSDRSSLPSIAKKCFSQTEFSYWNAKSEQQKTALFYHFWVRKEGFVKAVGRGISLGLNQCEVNPEHQSQFLSIPPGYGLATDWKIVDIPLTDNLVGAMIVKNQTYKFKRKHW